MTLLVGVLFVFWGLTVLALHSACSVGGDGEIGGGTHEGLSELQADGSGVETA